MKRVLFIAYHFPPQGGAGVQRSVKFARYLPELGWDPVIVTGPGETEDLWVPLDETLGGQLHERPLRVDRVAGPLPSADSDLRWRLERLAWFPTRFRRWWVDGVATVAARHRDVDLVYASMSPFDSGEAAAHVARSLGVPWVADLRDPWALDEMLEYPSQLHRTVERARMGRTLASAGAIVMNCPEAAHRLRQAFPALARIPVHVIPNGFDAADFTGPDPAADPERFRIIHTGSMHTASGRMRAEGGGLRRKLGGLAPVDMLTRSHVHLMDGLGRLIERRPDLAERIEVHLAGNLTDADRAVPGHGLIVDHGYLTHRESVRLVRSADLLFLPMQNLPAGQRATIVPGKTYEYLGSLRPVLAAVPEGDARDLLSELPWTKVRAPDDADGLAAAVEELATRKLTGMPVPAGDRDRVARFERRALTRDLASVFDALAPRALPKPVVAGTA